MPRIVVATTLYAMPLTWTDAFAAGLARELSGDAADVVVALDGIDEDRARHAWKKIFAAASVHFVTASGSRTAVRLAMLDKARGLSPEAAILIDADDVPVPGMIARHCKALEGADISFGDMEIIDVQDDNGTAFFDGAGIPDEVADPAPLERRNFMGLTNTALGRKALAETELLEPPEVIAFDWWLFTSLLARGCSARRTDGPVTYYRHRHDGLLSARHDPDVTRFAARCRMVGAHGRAFPHRPAVARYGADAERIAAEIEEDPVRAAPAITAACAHPGVWFSDVDRYLKQTAAA